MAPKNHLKRKKSILLQSQISQVLTLTRQQNHLLGAPLRCSVGLPPKSQNPWHPKYANPLKLCNYGSDFVLNRKKRFLKAMGGAKCWNCDFYSLLGATVSNPIKKMVSHVRISRNIMQEAMEAKPCPPMTSIMMHHFGKLVPRAFQWYAWFGIYFHFIGPQPYFTTGHKHQILVFLNFEMVRGTIPWSVIPFWNPQEQLSQ